MRRAEPGDRPAIEAFLAERAVISMFPLSNLLRHGMDGPHDRSMSFWLGEGPDGLTDVIGKTREGVLMPSCDGAPWTEAARALAGQEILGAIGPAAQARPLIEALGLAGMAAEIDEDEAQFAMRLDALIVPEGPGALRPLSEVDRAQMVAWRRDYGVEALGMTPQKATAQAEKDVAGYLEADTFRVLAGPDGPLALTGFNAEAPGIVQIGGVFTPPALRGWGHARRAVALHLAEARARGIGEATLFASGAAAIRAYEAIGFRRIGTWTLMIGREEVCAGG